MAFGKWGNKSRKQSGKNAMTLSDVIRGIQYCVNSCVEIVEQHYINTIEKYISEDDKVRSKRVYLDDMHYMDIPLICLTDHNALEVDTMKVKMKVNIRDMDLKQTMLEMGEGEEEETDAYSVSRTSMLIDVCNVSHEDDNTNMEIQMTFKASSPPESLSRILETLNNNLVVRMKEELDENGE